MSIRIVALYMLIAGLSIYAWKDWFKSLCGLVLLMAFIDHPDMPKTVFGIQGLNPWNVLFGAIFLAWLANRRTEGLMWDMPRHIVILLLMCLGVIVFGFLRAAFDRSYIEDYPLSSLTSEELINTIKWVLPGLLLFDGCRTHRRVTLVLICLFALYFLIAVQVIKAMPVWEVTQNISAMVHSRHKLNKEVGFNCTDLSVLLGGASWGILASLALIREKSYKMLVIAASGIIAFSQALTGGRGGYLAWAATGFMMCLMKWRKLLPLAPVVVILVPIIFPAVSARIWEGFGETNIAGQSTIDLNEGVTSGRWIFWPYVVDKIAESPLVGYGRLAMRRTGLKDFLRTEYDESQAVDHPHNMYMEILLDNGIIGSIPVFLLFMLMVVYSARLFRSNNHLCSAVGGLSLALTLSSLFGGITGQHFYPQEHTIGIWAAFFLSLRVYVDEKISTYAINTNIFWKISPDTQYIIYD